MPIDRLVIVSEGNALLDPGQARATDNTRTGSPTITLLVSGGKNLLVDSGCGQKLDCASEAEKLHLRLRKLIDPMRIDFIFLTHLHEDHANLTPYFKARVISDKSGIIIPGVISCPTPGHSPDHHSLLFYYNGKKVAIAGDAVINGNYFHAAKPEDRIYRPNGYSSSQIEQMIRSERLLADYADLIIPGHGSAFNPKE